MEAVAGSEEASPTPEFEARPLPPSMAVVGSALFGLFVAIVMATVVSLLVTDTPELPVLADLPLPEGVEVVGSIATCTDSACDGIGVVLAGSRHEAIAGRLASSWRASDWDSMPCVDDGSMCFGADDLRLSLSVWHDVDPLAIPTLVDAVTELGLDTSHLVYVHHYRCGPIHECDAASER